MPKMDVDAEVRLSLELCRLVERECVFRLSIRYGGYVWRG